MSCMCTHVISIMNRMLADYRRSNALKKAMISAFMYCFSSQMSCAEFGEFMSDYLDGTLSYRANRLAHFYLQPVLSFWWRFNLRAVMGFWGSPRKLPGLQTGGHQILPSLQFLSVYSCSSEPTSARPSKGIVWTKLKFSVFSNSLPSHLENRSVAPSSIILRKGDPKP